MPPRVTIAYDGSDGSSRAIEAAARLFAGADATVVTVPEPLPAPPSTEPVAQAWARLGAEIQAAAAELVDAGVNAARAAGLAAEGVVAEPRSPAWTGLVEAAADADVLVCGSRGRAGLARTLLGSTSRSLLHHSPVPLLTVPDAPVPDGPALIAYDGSEAAAHAIAAAGSVLGDRPVVVVHVWESPYRHSLTGRALSGVHELHELVEGLEDGLADAAGEVTARGVELARFAGLDASGETLDSGEGVWRALCAHAGDAAVIVSGARGHGGARSALLGSVSSGLVHNAERPVLIVPPAA